MCFADLNGDKAAEVAAANEKRAADNGAKVMAATVDVTEREQVRAMIAKAVEAFGKLDVKFNNAGVNKPMNAGSRSTASTRVKGSARNRLGSSGPLAIWPGSHGSLSSQGAPRGRMERPGPSPPSPI